MRVAAASLLLLSACDRADPMATDLSQALVNAAAAGRMVIAHFRIADRPLSVAMDAALPPDTLRAIAPEFVHCRLDAEQNVAALRRALAAPQRGACLATCLLDERGESLAASVGVLDAAGFAAFVANARQLGPERRACLALPEPARSLALAEHDQRRGRRDLAVQRLTALAQGDDRAAHAPARARLARWCAQDGDVAGARHWLAQVELAQVEASEDRELTAHVALTRAQVELHARAPRAALAALRTPPRAADRPAYLLCLGQCQHECGDTAAALTTLQTLQAQHDSSAEATAAARTIAHILDPNHGHSHGD